MHGDRFPPLTPEELRSVGQSLYGLAWRAELARALAASEQDVVRVEGGCMVAPMEWRGKLVFIAQEVAHRAMETASSLLCPHAIEDAPLYEPCQQMIA